MTDASPQLTPHRRSQDILSFFTWPILVTLPLVVFYHSLEIFGTGKGIGVGALFTFGLWFLFEWLCPYRHDWKKKTDRQLYNNIFHMTLSISGRIFLQQWFNVVAFVAISNALIQNDFQNVLTLWPSHWPAPLQIVLCLLIAEGLNYWRHRLLHETSWLWPMHTLHHSVDRLHSLKGGNTHIIEAALAFFVVVPPLILLGCPPEIFVWVGVANMVAPTHANIRMTLPAFVHYLAVTPAVHYLHHSKDIAYGNSNYASVLPIWDIVFGTFRHPDTHHYRTIGIDDDRMPDDLPGQLLAPFNWYRLEQRRDDSEGNG